MNDPHIILPSARIVAEPEPKQSQNGTPYLLIRVAANGSHKDKQTGQWVDHDTMFATILNMTKVSSPPTSRHSTKEPQYASKAI